MNTTQREGTPEQADAIKHMVSIDRESREFVELAVKCCEWLSDESLRDWIRKTAKEARDANGQ